MEIYTDDKDFVTAQFVSTRNIDPGVVTDWMFGGLNYQARASEQSFKFKLLTWPGSMMTAMWQLLFDDDDCTVHTPPD